MPAALTGPYTLPRELRDRLTAALSGFRNREAAFALAVFLARYWSTPARLTQAFPIDRRALTEHHALGLTEARVRGAIEALEAVGFIARDVPPPGSRYRATAEGLHRRPVLFRFGSEYGPGFARANSRVQAARQIEGARRPITPFVPSPPVMSHSPNSPKDKSEADKPLLMGEQRERAEPTATGLEAALERWRNAIGLPG